MIDLNPSANDQRVLDAVREEALIARGYARYYDENEHEFPPDELPEAKGRPSFMSQLGERTEHDAGMAVLTTLIAMGQTWGDYSVRMRRNERGLGNSALQAAGTPEQKQKWGDLTLAMVITEPGCGSDPSLVRTTATRDGDDWVLNGEKIFVTTGCRAEGVVVWATVDRAAGRAGIKSFLVPKGTPGFIVAHKEKKLGIRADDTAAYVFQDCRIPRDHLLGATSVSGFGDTFVTGGKVVKNVTGYDICKILTGSWGTLSVMTEVTLKVMPKAESEITLVLRGLDDVTANRAMTAALGSPFDVSGAACLPGATG